MNEYQPVHYTESLAGIDPFQLAGGFFATWSNPPSAETLFRILQNSSHLVLAVDERTIDVVGFITAITDGDYAAWISFVQVLPEYHQQGIENGLVERMLGILRPYSLIECAGDSDLYDLLTSAGLHPVPGRLFRRTSA